MDKHFLNRLVAQFRFCFTNGIVKIVTTFMPNHPGFTHLTITFGIIILPSMAALLYFVYHEKLPKRAWILAPFIALIFSGLIYMTMYTGALDFEYGQDYLNKEVVNTHSNIATFLILNSLISLTIAVLSLKKVILRVLFIISLLGIFGLTIVMVITGSRIVYQ